MVCVEESSQRAEHTYSADAQGTGLRAASQRDKERAIGTETALPKGREPGFGDAGTKGCREGSGSAGRGGSTSRPDPQSGSVHRAGFLLSSKWCQELGWGEGQSCLPMDQP